MEGKRHRLVSARKAAGFSQERLAEVVGVERTTVMRWERGQTRPQPCARPKLARALGISDQSLAELLGEPAEPEGAASAPGPIAGEVASPYRQDFLEHSVVFPGLRSTSCGTSDRPLTTLGATWMSRASHRDGRRSSFVKPCPAAWAEPSPSTSSGSQSSSCLPALRWTGMRIP